MSWDETGRGEVRGEHLGVTAIRPPFVPPPLARYAVLAAHMPQTGMFTFLRGSYAFTLPDARAAYMELRSFALISGSTVLVVGVYDLHKETLLFFVAYRNGHRIRTWGFF